MKRKNQNGVLAAVCVVLAVLLVILLAVVFMSDSRDPAAKPEDTEGNNVPSTTTEPETTAVPVTEAPTETTVTFVPEIHPDTVGIYIPAGDGTSVRKRITEFPAKRTAKTDIDCFEIIASQEEQLKGSSFASIWNTAWDAYEGTQNAKIGFHITFTLTNGETISKQLLKPSDSAEFYDYLEIYLYDDIHQTPGVWYTHLDDADITEETIISSIKLTSGSKIQEVGDITLTAFIYNDENNFDQDGNYIGLVLSTIIITA